MALEVVGSNPTIYLFINKKLSPNNIVFSLTYKNINACIYIIRKLTINTLQKNLNKNHYTQLINFITKYTNELFINSCRFVNTPPSTYNVYKNKHLYSLINNSFSKFTNIAFFTQNTTVVVNRSFSPFFINKNKNGTIKVLSVLKFYNNYKNTLNFIYNIYYYRLQAFFFGNIFLKKEVFSLN